MSQLLIQHYLNDLADLRRVSGSQRESVVREAFKTLLKNWGRNEGLLFIPEYEHTTATDERRYVDGALVEPQLRLPVGYWEAKDTSDDLDAEIAKKFRRGYPQDNIIFEDSLNAVLIQNRREVLRCSVEDPKKIGQLVEQFFKFEPEVIREFRKAVDQFKEDLPAVLETLRKAIDKAEAVNSAFKKAAANFLAHAQDTINPSVTAADVREMLIQHILTEEIFSQIFDDNDFHRHNNVAKELYGLEGTFFTGGVKRETIERLRPYYSAIKRAAASVASHQEKQKFLKVIYESFYKIYNRKAADRLGVAYTPNEIVRFMIESADWLCESRFGKQLIDRNVEILDPATGTGTFIVDLLEHFRGQPAKLRYKYLEELHANEVAILPYYVANLNIEATYAAITNEYLEYPNLCFVDTLDNTAGLGIYAGHQFDMLGALSDVNIERIKRQNRRKISVVIGNPPYNAWQENFNSRNPNRPYKRVDERIKTTYGVRGSAQNQSSLYDMYVRFFRWAADRVDRDGIIAFISNRNFIEKTAFDGFRHIVEKEFSEIWIVDLGGDVRANPKLSGTKHNVFGIQTGVAISFFVKRSGKSGATIKYSRRPEMETRAEKLSFLGSCKIADISFEILRPDEKSNWIHQPKSDWDTLLPLAAPKDANKKSTHYHGIFRLLSNGVQTKRDEWAYDFNRVNEIAKANYLVATYEATRKNKRYALKNSIKWDADLERYLESNIKINLDANAVISAAYRPFVNAWLFFERHFNSRVFQLPHMFRPGEANPTITFLCIASDNELATLATDRVFDLGFLKKGNGGTNQGVSLYRYADDGTKVDNITETALKRFVGHYEKGRTTSRKITKQAIFQYVYAILHDPVYRETYALHLKRDIPRIPLYGDFWTWADWGERLLALHIDFEHVMPWKLKRVTILDKTAKGSGVDPKAVLKAVPAEGVVKIDSVTELQDIPEEAWEYRLGNRSAIEWVLDQHKETVPKDATIREKFNTYRFAEHKEKVIDLLKRVTSISVETVKIVEEMRSAKRN
jgi:predicted helicase